MKKEIKDLAERFAPEFIQIRRHFHAHPELSFQEFETSAFIKSRLTEWGLPFDSLAGTGISGTIKGRNPDKKVIALRADMDALPIGEENKVSYRSQKEGVMHACGHDLHMTCLLGTIKILQRLSTEFEGTVKYIFQPGEEKVPGGARVMMEEGVLENPRPCLILGLHASPELEAGTAGFRAGSFMASVDDLFICIKARGGHAAAPHLTADPILAASHIIIGLQELISRNKNPLLPSVLSITAIHGGSSNNVIPGEVRIKGTFRSLDEDWRVSARDLIKKRVEAIASAFGAEAETDILVGYPSLQNDPVLTSRVMDISRVFLGKEQVLEVPQRLGSEDFAFYTRALPACFLRLGVGNSSKGISSNLHSPTFDIDEKAIETGMGLMAYLAVSLLGKK